MSVGFAGAVFEEGRKRRKEEGRAVDKSFGTLGDQGLRSGVFCYCFGHLEPFTADGCLMQVDWWGLRHRSRVSLGVSRNDRVIKNYIGCLSPIPTQQSK